jgi:hypothetical protein
MTAERAELLAAVAAALASARQTIPGLDRHLFLQAKLRRLESEEDE